MGDQPRITRSARRDRDLEDWCRREWQTHERHGRVGLPFHRDRHPCLAAPGCPEILAALVAYCEVIAPAATGDLMERLERLTGEKPMEEPAAWQQVYAPELADHPTLGRYLVDNDLIEARAWVFERAGLTSREQDVMRLALAGYGLKSIVRVLKRNRTVTAAQLAEGTEKLRLMPRARARTHDGRALANSEKSPIAI